MTLSLISELMKRINGKIPKNIMIQLYGLEILSEMNLLNDINMKSPIKLFNKLLLFFAPQD